MVFSGITFSVALGNPDKLSHRLPLWDKISRIYVENSQLPEILLAKKRAPIRFNCFYDGKALVFECNA